MSDNALSLVFMGNPDFAVPSFERLHHSGHSILSVVTGTDKRRGRGGNKAPSPVKKAALEVGIPVIETDDVTSESCISQIEALMPDLLVVVAFKLLPAEVLAIPKIGSLNLHASLLPKYRGAAPIHHALINGEQETGCTVFLLDEGMDTGLILNQHKTKVDILDTTGDLYDRLAISGAELLRKTVDEISRNEHTVQEQKDHLSSRAPKITPETARIDFTKDGMAVHNLIRGMSPFPGAWTEYEGKKLIILRSKPAPERSLNPGQAVLKDRVAYAGCGTGSVILEEVKSEGRNTVSGAEFLAGCGGAVQLS